MLEYYRFKQVLDLFSSGKFEDARFQLTELQRRYVALCDENITYKTRIQEYEDILYLAQNLFYDGVFFWLVTGNIKQGPFCSECYNRDGLLMRLFGEGHERHCPYCKKPYPAEIFPEEIAMVVPDEQMNERSALQRASGSGKVIKFRR